MSEPLLRHYKLETPIGVGSMGEVFSAIDTRLHRRVAIKICRSVDAGGSPGDAARRMLREARAASALNHPNIVIIHDFGETDDGDAFIVQEFIAGRTLRDRLGEPMPLADAIDIGVQVARALAAAHSAGVVHRDIKPENVMLRADGYAKVLDFGIAHLPTLAMSSVETALETLAESLAGTPAYMAPEMMLSGTIGPPADIFALGVMLFEAITGRLPFTAATPMGVLARIATEPAPPMTSIDPSIPTALDAFVQSMLEKDPALRPTADDVVRLLPAFADSADAPVIVAAGEAVAFTVGRSEDLARLASLFASVAAGRSVVAGVSGEPGIGKSTLLEAFMVELQNAKERPTVIRVRCSENLGASEAYLPVLEALDALRTGRSSLDALMRTVAPTWHVQVTGGAAQSTASQEQMKRELRAYLHEVSRRAPLVWIIEDLHWADVSTVDILNYVAARFDDMRVMIVAAFRNTDMLLARHPFLEVRAQLQSRGVYAEIALDFLSRADVERYLALRWPSNDFPPSFAADIHARTEGNPLFMADLVRYLHDTGTIAEHDGVWTVDASRAGATSELPESVKGMIARKIERVGEDDRKLLLAASVQGEEFDSAPVAEALGLDVADVEERLDALQSVHRLVQLAGEAEYPDGSPTLRYRFVHVLYQNVLHASLQPARRASLSSRTANALVAHRAGDAAPFALRLAVLFEAARAFAPAGQYFYLAAQRAASLFAFRETLALAERGLAGVSKLPADPTRHQIELGLQMIRALALRLVRGWAAAELEPTLARASELCHQLNDPPELFPVLWNVAFFKLLRGNLEVVRQDVATMNATARGEPAFQMAADHIAGVACEFAGDVRRSTELLERARAAHDPAQHARYSAMYGMDPGMIARAMSSRPLWALGLPDKALERSLETIALSESQQEPVTFTFALILSQGIHLYRGELDEVIALGDRIEVLCREYEFAQETEWGRAFQGSAYSRAGETERGADQLAAAVAGMAALRTGLVRTMFLSLLADAQCRAGRVDAGVRTVDEGFAYAESSGERGFLHELHRVRGELLLRADRVADAEASLRQAVDHARQQSARSFELRAATSLARLLAATKRSAEGRALLAPVLESFTEGYGTADLKAAREVSSA